MCVGPSCTSRQILVVTWAVEERTDKVAAEAVVDNTPSRVGCAGLNCNAAADGDGVPS